MFGKGVDQTSGGNVCTAASGDTCQAGASGSGPAAFTTPAVLAVDGSSGASSGDVYVGDTGDTIVSKFDSGGNLVTGWQSGGQLSLGGMAGVAVDTSGNLFAFDGGTVFKYTESGASVTNFPVPRESDPIGLAVDSADSLFKVNADPSVEEFTASADIGQVTNSDTTTGLAVDQSNNSLYVDGVDGIGDIGFFTSSGPASCVPANFQGCEPAEAFGGAKLHGAQGLGVDASNGVVYAASTSTNNVAVSAPRSSPTPSPASSKIRRRRPPRSPVTSIPPAANISDCHFDYGTDTTYSLGSVPCSPSTPYSSSTDVTAQITGPTSGATYDYRVVATDATGTSNGDDHAFQTEASNVSHALSGYIGGASSNTPIRTRCPGRPTSASIRRAMTSTSPIRATTGSRSSTPPATSSSCSAKGSIRPPAATSAPRPRATPAKPVPRAASAGGFQTPTYLAVDNSNSRSKGDIYVGDTGDNLVSKFDSSGHIVSGWGPGRNKDGSDTDLTCYCLAAGMTRRRRRPSNGNLYVGGACCDNVFQYTPDGTYEGPYQNVGGAPWLKVDPPVTTSTRAEWLLLLWWCWWNRREPAADCNNRSDLLSTTDIRRRASL